eukprot:TRINITY_DN1605_c0_g1_i11.p1 TRINITY_DN1605_c0_g1~~TRINITY_DN1605_c0_g1_i11.p1  ORF type:complete len:246 (-),score=43.93 TRINITY_DN1605_c0_g1_i11:624-1361(-)
MTLPTKGVLALAGGVAFHIILGCLYMYGGISIYLASYYRQFDSSVTTRFLITFLPLRGLMVIFCIPYGGHLTRQYGPRFTTLIGGGVVIVCLFALIFVTNKYLFLLFYSSTFGISTLNFMAPIICSWKHFPSNRGTVSGIVIAGFALGPLIFNFVNKIVVNPLGLPPTISEKHGDITDHFYGPEVANNVPTMYVILLIIWGAMIVFTYFTLRDPQTIGEALYQSMDTFSKDENIHDSIVMSRTLS